MRLRNRVEQQWKGDGAMLLWLFVVVVLVLKNDLDCEMSDIWRRQGVLT